METLSTFEQQHYLHSDAVDYLERIGDQDILEFIYQS